MLQRLYAKCWHSSLGERGLSYPVPAVFFCFLWAQERDWAWCYRRKKKVIMIRAKSFMVESDISDVTEEHQGVLLFYQF